MIGKANSCDEMATFLAVVSITAFDSYTWSFLCVTLLRLTQNPVEFRPLSFSLVQPRISKVDVTLDDTQRFVIDAVLVAEVDDGVALDFQSLAG